MTEYKDEFIFELSKPLEYHKKGEIAFTNELILKAPSSNKKRFTSKLRQGYYAAQIELSSIFDKMLDKGELEKRREDEEKKESSKSEEQKKEDLMETFLTCMRSTTKVDYGDYHDTFKEFLTRDIAFCSEDIAITKTVYNDISDNDTERLLGEYMANFLLT